MNAEILAVGHELLMGEIVDTNSAYIAQQLAGTGITVRWMSHVGDDLDHLSEAFARGLERSDVVVSTGGLGPTSDDLTREALARTLGEEPRVDPDILRWLRGVFENRGIEMPETNVKQATLIPSATSIPNPGGTAPGWWVSRDGHYIVLLPGPPREVRRLWGDTVGPRLAALSGAGAIVTRTLKTHGITEGGVDELLSPLFGQENPYLGIYAHADGIHLRLIARGPDEQAARALITPVETEIRARVGGAIWGVDDETPAGRAAELLTGRGQRLAVMEGASAGGVASLLYAHPLRARFFAGALIDGGIGPGSRNGAVSASAAGAAAMARSAREMLGADVGLGISPISGEGDDDPPGCVFVNVVSGAGEHSAQTSLPRRSPQWVMQRSATVAMMELVTALGRGLA